MCWSTVAFHRKKAFLAWKNQVSLPPTERLRFVYSDQYGELNDIETLAWDAGCFCDDGFAGWRIRTGSGWATDATYISQTSHPSPSTTV
jgi:hypothetical protein